MWHQRSAREELKEKTYMWFKISVREELKEKILNKLSKSERKEQDVEFYAHDYAYRLELGKVKPGNERLVERGIEEVYRRINESKNK